MVMQLTRNSESDTTAKALLQLIITNCFHIRGPHSQPEKMPQKPPGGIDVDQVKENEEESSRGRNRP